MSDNNELVEKVGPAPSRFTNALSTVITDLGKNGIFLALIAVVVLFSFLTNGILLRPQNISNLIVQNGYILILAIGMVIVIVAGHIDLSVGSVAAFIGAVVGEKERPRRIDRGLRKSRPGIAKKPPPHGKRLLVSQQTIRKTCQRQVPDRHT